VGGGGRGVWAQCVPPPYSIAGITPAAAP
jgi:hypothetical protein